MTTKDRRRYFNINKRVYMLAIFQSKEIEMKRF